MGSSNTSFTGEGPTSVVASQGEPLTEICKIQANVTRYNTSRPIRSVCLGFLSSNFCQIKELLCQSKAPFLVSGKR